uniref:16S rRNA (uracil(1498)-N(3))-methyltransferase n=1 Tax=Leersia perrieri TaxID=77586 RepID=A0A0D9VYJ9_9ORYZ
MASAVSNPVFLREDGSGSTGPIKPATGGGYGPGSLHALVHGRGRDVADEDKLQPLPLPPSRRAHSEERGGATRVPAWHVGPTIVVRIRPPQQHDPFLAAYVACIKGKNAPPPPPKKKKQQQQPTKKKMKAKAVGCGVLWNGWEAGGKYTRVMSCRHDSAVTVMQGAAPLPAGGGGVGESPAHPTLNLSRLPVVSCVGYPFEVQAVSDIGIAFQGEVVRIQGDEFWHMTRVLRLGINDRVELFDGAGGLVEGSIQKVRKGGSDVELLEDARLIAPQGIQWHVYAAFGECRKLSTLTESTRKVFSSIAYHFTIPSPRDIERWTRRLACREMYCQRIHGMLLNSPMQIADLQSVSQSKLAFLASAESPPVLSTLPKSCNEESGLLIVGPEGDFTEEEVNILKTAGAVPVGLGPCRLRVETATISLLSALMLWSDAHRQ